jgi:predicted nuclease of predicted toxin-antitoxin system
MKIKLDENLPRRLANPLKKFGHEVHTVHEEKLIGRPDMEIWAAVQKESRFLITQDLDFSDSRKFAHGSHHGILLIRLRNPNRRALIERIEEMLQNENIEEWKGCFVIATERKTRLLRPERKLDS